MTVRMKVELVAYTPKPIELCGKAAGISWDKEKKEDYDAFIRRIIRMGHESVIEHATFTFRVEGVSRALSHQWVRHRICSFTQRSQRRVDESGSNYILPPLDYIQDEERRDNLINLMRDNIENAFGIYRKLRDAGVKGEDARFVLPNATETKMHWTANARELRHFFKLRLHKDAQWEIREMAKRMYDLVAPIAPAMFEDLKKIRETGED